MDDFYQDSVYTREDYTVKPLPRGEYDNCQFIACTFEKIHLSNYTFLECNFEDCNFTNTTFGGTSFQQVTFENCKLLGADFSVCNSFMLGVSFRESILSFAIFSSLVMKQTPFLNCNLTDADFTNADVSASDYSGSNLVRAVFENTILDKADFREAIDYEINPSKNSLKGTIFVKGNLTGLVQHLPISIK